MTRSGMERIGCKRLLGTGDYMITGQNPGLAYRILAENFRRLGSSGIGLKPPIDAAYCLDAPDVLAAGSTERYQSDPDDDSDWYDMPTMVYRVPNVQHEGAPALSALPLDAPVGREEV